MLIQEFSVLTLLVYHTCRCGGRFVPVAMIDYTHTHTHTLTQREREIKRTLLSLLSLNLSLFLFCCFSLMTSKQKTNETSNKNDLIQTYDI